MNKPSEKDIDEMADECVALEESGKGDQASDATASALRWVLGLDEKPDFSYLE